jgi:hypothetical protein
LLATITRATTTTTTTGTSFYLFIFSSFSCEKKNSLDGTMPEIIIIISQLLLRVYSILYPPATRGGDRQLYTHREKKKTLSFGRDE